MKKNLTTRAKREMAQAKTNLMTPAQMKKAGISQYSPSYVQKKFTAEMKKLDDKTRATINYGMKMNGLTKSDVLTYIQVMEKHNARRQEQIDKIVSGELRIVTPYEREVIGRAQAQIKAGYHATSMPSNIVGLPTEMTFQSLRYGKPKYLKKQVKSATNVFDLDKYTKKAVTKVRADFTKAIENKFGENSELIKKVRTMNREQFLKWAFGHNGNEGAVDLNAHEIFSGDGTDADELDDILESLLDLVDVARE